MTGGVAELDAMHILDVGSSGLLTVPTEDAALLCLASLASLPRLN